MAAAVRRGRGRRRRRPLLSWINGQQQMSGGGGVAEEAAEIVDGHSTGAALNLIASVLASRAATRTATPGLLPIVHIGSKGASKDASPEAAARSEDEDDDEVVAEDEEWAAEQPPQQDDDDEEVEGRHGLGEDDADGSVAVEEEEGEEEECEEPAWLREAEEERLVSYDQTLGLPIEIWRELILELIAIQKDVHAVAYSASKHPALQPSETPLCMPAAATTTTTTASAAAAAGPYYHSLLLPPQRRWSLLCGPLLSRRWSAMDLPS